MRALIGANFLKSKEARPGPKPFDVRDTRLKGFVLRVQPSGVRSYNVQIGRSQRISLGKVGAMTPEEARERCSKVLGNVAHGRPPLHGIDGAEPDASPTLEDFVTGTYEPWLKAHRPRRADANLKQLKTSFGHWYPRTLASLTVEDIEKWRIERLGEGVKSSSITRYLNILAGVLTRAVKLKKLHENVVRQVERPVFDRNRKVRFLATEEEVRLREALNAGDYNGRRSHLEPAVLVSLHTGVRRGELLALTWDNVTLTGAHPHITVLGDTSEKSSQTRHIPLNAEALAVLKEWRSRNGDAERVFDVESFRSAWPSLLKRAKITRFRWHDLRHHFASRLVQKGVPLNTVRDLLGHSDIKMTLRYAHLAPDQRKEAVELLVAP